MIILMCGLPRCGKSVVADTLTELCDVHLIRPAEWDTGAVDSKIASWKLALEYTLDRAQHSAPSEVTILDSGNSKYATLVGIISEAHKNGHAVLLVYVDSTTSECMTRPGSEELSVDIYESYIDKLMTSLPKYKSACDAIWVIKNHDSINKLRQDVKTKWIGDARVSQSASV